MGAIIILAILVVASFLWNYQLVTSSNTELVVNKSRAFFEQILVTRYWNAEHGGVYVHINDKTQPNEYLKDSLRELVTINGSKLTKINPAYMTRQIAEINKAKSDLQFHITSLNPIRPLNKADEWEAKSLKMFESGIKENFELIEEDSIEQYRYMAPLVTEQSCLNCHAVQGYKYGDIRGGISIAFTAKPYLSSLNKQIFTLEIFHASVLVLGILGLILYYRMSNKYVQIIENKNKELTKSNMEKEKFFSIIAHDLRAPFNGFLGLTKMISEDIFELSKEEIQEFADALNESAENLFVLLENLLAWSRLKRNVMDFNPENINLLKIVNSSSKILKAPIDNKKQTLHIDVSEEINVYVDKQMLDSVVRNLISNASKFTNTGGSIFLTAKVERDSALISVRDTGIGIPKSMINKLFILGEKTSRKGTDDETSSGLGLILCKDFIEKNNGKLWVESQEGIGTTFYFTLPLS